MSALHKLQGDFRRALLRGEEDAILDLVEADGIAAPERLAVYRNNVVASITAALKEIFPVFCRLVGEPFFDEAARSIINHRPPTDACLAHYGERFPAFVRNRPPCSELDYLASVAALEWRLHRAATAPDREALTAAALAATPPAETPRLRFTFHPAYGVVESAHPIDRIWRANRPDASSKERSEPIDVTSGGVGLEVMRRGETVAIRSLTPADYYFRAALWEGETLEAATEAAFVQDEGFDLAAAIAALFREGLVVAVAG